MVLEQATVPKAPVRSTGLYLIAALLLALGVGVAVAVLLENADPVLVSDEHLKEAVELPLLASIPTLS